MLTDKRKIIISSGNILNVNKKAGQKTHEEVSQLQNFEYFPHFIIASAPFRSHYTHSVGISM